MKMVELSPEQIESLGCININGLDRERLQVVREGQGLKTIHLKADSRDPSKRLLILDGHHTAAIAMERRVGLQAFLWEEGDDITDNLVRLNFGRAEKFNDTAMILGKGVLGALLENQ